MRKVRSTDTEPELKFRKALWAAGFRYNVNFAVLAGKPDVVFPSRRLAVFIDGDFWHGNQWRARRLSSLDDQFLETPQKSYWLNKINGNIRRDHAVTGSLLKAGWKVLRFWESEIRSDLEKCVEITIKVLREGAEPNSVSLLPHKTFAEFFAGVGLMRIGLEAEGWSCSFANDIDIQKFEMYKGHFGGDQSHFAIEDVHRLSAGRVPTVALATASFPCNDLSVAGSRNGLSGGQSSAFWGFVRILEELDDRRPPIVLLENVTGFLSSNKGDDFRQALLAMNRLGYLVDAFILDASRFVPQSRRRLFVVGVMKNDESDFSTGNCGVLETDVRPKALARFIEENPQVLWAVRDLPSQPRNNAPLESIVEDLPMDADEWWSPERAEYLLSQMSPKHLKIAREMIAGPGWSHGVVFRRMRKNKSTAELRTDGLAGCLRTPRGGSGRQILVKAGNGEFYARLITPREAARLMGADDYRITGPPHRALFGFGDAVCVPVIEWIARYYLNPLVNRLIRGRPLVPPVEGPR